MANSKIEEAAISKAVDDLIECLKQDDLKNGDCYWANHMIIDFLTQIKEQIENIENHNLKTDAHLSIEQKPVEDAV